MTSVTQAAAEIIALINARPASPRQEEIEAIIAKAVSIRPSAIPAVPDLGAWLSSLVLISKPDLPADVERFMDLQDKWWRDNDPDGPLHDDNHKALYDAALSFWDRLRDRVMLGDLIGLAIVADSYSDMGTDALGDEEVVHSLHPSSRAVHEMIVGLLRFGGVIDRDGRLLTA